jgi:hypothetical protein
MLQTIWNNLDKIEKLLAIVGGAFTIFGGIYAAFFAFKNFLKWLSPIKIEPGYSLWCDNGETPDSITTTLINNTNKTQYIVSCTARGTHSVMDILKVHNKNPFLKPSLYPNVWYNGPVYGLLKDGSLKIEPHEPVKLECKLYNHPLNAMFTEFFIITVKLSSGKTIKSKRIKAPPRWRQLGKY